MRIDYASRSLAVSCLVVLVSACGGGGGGGAGTGGTLPPPAANAGTLQFAASSVSGNEGETVVISVTRAGGTTGTASVTCSSNGGTATSGQDYTAVNTTLSWADGESASKPCNVSLTDDNVADPNETINLTLTNVSGATLGSPAAATVTIVDGDSGGSLQFSASSYTVNEASGTVTIAVTRNGGSAGAVAVNYATANGTAQAPGDYTAKSGTLNWVDGDSANKTFTISVVNDASAEGPETVQLSLSGATGGATLGANASATLVIDDTPGTILFTKTDFAVLENAGTAHVTVSRQGGSNGAVSVDFTTADAAPNCPDQNDPTTCEIASRRIAKPTLDYTPTAGTLTFLDGETSKDILIPITFPDTDPDAVSKPEPAETLDIALCQATGTNVGNQVRAVLTIADFQASANPGIVLSPTANNRPGDVPVNIRPEITLTSLVDQASLTSTSAKVRCDTGSGTVEILSAQAIFDPDETTVTIVPQTPLPSAGAACVAVLTSGVKDPSGAPITATELVSLSFTTGSTTDTTRPTVTDPSPPPNTTGVNPNTTVIGATINDYMLNTLSINPRNIQLSYNDGTVERIVAGTVNFVPNIDLPSGGNIALPVTFKPACPLRANTQYTVRFKGAGVNKPIRDVVGNALLADVTWSFTTAP
jgi:hypothetical protein